MPIIGTPIPNVAGSLSTDDLWFFPPQLGLQAQFTSVSFFLHLNVFISALNNDY